MADKMDDLKKAMKEQTDKVNLARESKKKLAGMEDKLQVATAAMRKAAPGAKTHTVAADDTLGGIAKKYGLANWKELYEANKDVIGDDPNKIRAGMELKIPK
ncbi:MAG: LysM peptidoglycan-binding domain-containing protein [Chloroflexi bacterium]|nr:LysM peptidoglycan-binding domain-containing protein [Chloroflexota bacterium]